MKYSEDLAHEMYFHINRGVDGWLNFMEACCLWQWVEVQASVPVGRYVEIGCFHGKSTIFECQSLPSNEKLWVIDTFQGDDTGVVGDTYESFVRNTQGYRVWDKIEVLKGYSSEVPWTDSIRYIFVDGTHTYEGVSADVDRFSPFVSAGGVMLFHDYGGSDFKGVSKRVRELRDSPGWEWVEKRSSVAVLRKI